MNIIRQETLERERIFSILQGKFRNYNPRDNKDLEMEIHMIRTLHFTMGRYFYIRPGRESSPYFWKLSESMMEGRETQIYHDSPRESWDYIDEIMMEIHRMENGEIRFTNNFRYPMIDDSHKITFEISIEKLWRGFIGISFDLWINGNHHNGSYESIMNEYDGIHKLIRTLHFWEFEFPPEFIYDTLMENRNFNPEDTIIGG